MELFDIAVLAVQDWRWYFIALFANYFVVKLTRSKIFGFIQYIIIFIKNSKIGGSL